MLQLTCFAGLTPKLPNPVKQYLFIAAASGVVPDDTFTVTQAINSIGFGRFQIVLSFVVGLCWMADSMEMMILSILPLALHCEWGINQYRQAFLTTIVFIGMMVSSTFWGKISDRFGRKQALIVSGIFLFFYGFLSTFSPSYPWILCLRYQTTQTLVSSPNPVLFLSAGLWLVSTSAVCPNQSPSMQNSFQPNKEASVLSCWTASGHWVPASRSSWPCW